MVIAINSSSSMSGMPLAHKIPAPAPAPAGTATESHASAAHAAQAGEAMPAAPSMPNRAPLPLRKNEPLRDMEQMRKNLNEALERINEMMRDGGRELQFSIDNRLDLSIILVKNRETGEVIRQIPADVVLKVAQSIEDLKGMLHNQAV